MSESTVTFMAKAKYGVKHGPQGRPRVITRVHDLRIKREVARLKKHQEKVASGTIRTNCNVEAARRTIQQALSFLKRQKDSYTNRKTKKNRSKHPLTGFDREPIGKN